jgi:hypothetical protein
MQAALAARALMEAALRLGIQYQQFVLHYQPQVDDAKGVIGAEALLRWHHPERSTVYPDQFIPLAEDTGLILPIGQWVLEAACAQLKQWATDPRARHLKLSINVSARQFRQVDFVDRVQRALRAAGARAAHLLIELTESVVLEDVEDTISKMQQLKKLGVGFAMDDFGTGYSSLSYLTRLPWTRSRSTDLLSATCPAVPTTRRSRKRSSHWPRASGWRSPRRASKPRNSGSSSSGTAARSIRAICLAGPWISRSSNGFSPSNDVVGEAHRGDDQIAAPLSRGNRTAHVRTCSTLSAGGPVLPPAASSGGACKRGPPVLPADAKMRLPLACPSSTIDRARIEMTLPNADRSAIRIANDGHSQRASSRSKATASFRAATSSRQP